MNDAEMSPTVTEKTTGNEIFTFPDGLQYKMVNLPDGREEALYFSDNAKRFDNESFEMYKIRRSIMNKVYRNKRKGVKVWPPIGFKNIPFTHELDERIGLLYESILKQKKENDGN